MPDTPVRNINQESDFKDKLIKLIPAEIIAAYMAIDGFLANPGVSSPSIPTVVVAVFLLVLTPFYLINIYKVANKFQIVFTMCTFVVWLYSLGGPFKFWKWPNGLAVWEPKWGAIVLMAWTLLIPLCVPSKPDGKPAGS
jgi:hypothetical protein